MKKLIIHLLTTLTITVFITGAAPQYAKWGKIALEETQRRYKADILDYEHIGRTDLTSKKSEKKLKLWIRSKEWKEFVLPSLLKHCKVKVGSMLQARIGEIM